MPFTVPVRLEFIIPSSGNNCVNSSVDYTGFGNTGDNIKFVSSSISNLNYSIQFPLDYTTNSDPLVFLPRHIAGDPLAGGDAGSQTGFQGYRYNSSNSPSGAGSGNLPFSAIGSCWGVAYSKQAGVLFTSAFMKRHSGYGPLGSGGIYKIVPNPANYIASAFYNLDANGYRTRASSSAVPYGPNSSYTVASGQTVTYLGPNDPLTGKPEGLGVIGINNTQRLLPPNKEADSYDPAAFDQVGKVGLGDLEISDDGKFLFAINLYSRKLVRMELNDPVNPTSVIAVTEFNVPSVTTTNGTYRPFAVTYYRGKVYIGMVTTGEDGGNVNDLYAYVFEMNNPKNGSAAFNTSPILTVPLNYQKGYANKFLTAPDQKLWHRWTNSTADIFHLPPDYPEQRVEFCWVSPILSNIEFTDRGDMILDFTDRSGHQHGFENYLNLDENGATFLWGYNTSGDILIAGLNCTGGYTLENNGAYNSNGINYSSSGVGNNQGPAGGEFFNGEFEPTEQYHQETSQGAVAMLRGNNDGIFTIMDPVVVYSGGTRRFNSTNANITNSVTTYEIGDGFFSKANGLGDIELIKENSPLEIGNRVWMDTDGDGVQDADEMGLDGVTVKLFHGTTLVSTKTTANGGQYYFNTADGLLPNTAYTIRIESASIPSGKSVTLKDQPTGGVQDLGDNDASLVGANADITYTTGNAGENNHTLDFGFSPVLTCSSSITATPGTCNSSNNQYTLTGSVTFTNPPATGTLTVQVAGGGSQVFNAPFTSPINYSISGQNSDGATHTVTATFSAEANCTSSINYSAPASCGTTPCGTPNCGSVTKVVKRK